MRVRADEIGLRVLSLLLALLLWFGVASDRGAQVSLAAPLEILNLPQDLEVVGGAPRTVDVWVRGRAGLAQKLEPGEVFVALDLSGAVAGQRVVHVPADSVRVPYGVRTVAVVPASFPITLERTLQKLVPIKPSLAGRPAPGYQVAGLTADPVQVQVSGPESRVGPLTGLPTEPVSVEQAKMTLFREVGLPLTDPHVRVVDPRRIRVTVRVVAADAR
jgi:YbbR domain-containing protein